MLFRPLNRLRQLFCGPWIRVWGQESDEMVNFHWDSGLTVLSRLRVLPLLEGFVWHRSTAEITAFVLGSLFWAVWERRKIR